MPTRPWLLLLLAACGPDLPEGWEDAEPIDNFGQSECAGDPYGETETEVRATVGGPGIEIIAEPMHFRCAQEVEGFLRQQGDALDVLVQPVDMDPSAVAGCDCLYTITAGLPFDPPATITVYQRWDNLNEPNDPLEVASTTVP